ncbi:MAG: cation transporter [Clostridia bacterium]|nr:cation transporter [Clostridia bacterium]MBQ9774391.1 cation transporter [Clostridia bacterium]
MTELLSRLFVKNNQQTADPRVRAAYGTMVSITGIVLNLLLFAAKFSVGFLFGAISIMGDAINNLSDAGSQIISLISFRIAAKPADREHPFGHGRIEYVASMVVSFLVLLIGVELLRESFNKILHPSLPERSWIAVAVLGGSILVKLWLALFNRKIGKRIDSAVMRATATDSLSDVLSTGAVLVATLVLLLFPKFTVNLDAYMGLIVAILILVAGARILNDAKNAILGGAPADSIVKQITDTVAKYPEALGIHDMTVHNYGPGRIIAALHIEVDGRADIFETHDIIDTIEQELRRECGISATIHMDPIVTDDEQVNAMRATVLSIVQSIDPALQIHDFRFVTGKTHTNLIFDVSAPFELRLSDEELRREIASRVSRLDPSYFTVITIDRL